jgi:hypothetical protein
MIRSMVVALTMLFVGGGCSVVNPVPSTEQARQSLYIEVRPHFQPAPGTIDLIFRLEPLEEGRFLYIAIVSGAYGRSSLIPLSGQRRFDNRYGGLPPGDYEVTSAIVGQGDRILARTMQRFRVLNGAG